MVFTFPMYFKCRKGEALRCVGPESVYNTTDKNIIYFLLICTIRDGTITGKV